MVSGFEKAREGVERVQEARAESQARKHYECEVNKGSFNVAAFERQLNERWDSGWQLSHIFEQAGNTVVVWARRAGPGDAT